jgi:hypothetical protein
MDSLCHATDAICLGGNLVRHAEDTLKEGRMSMLTLRFASQRLPVLQCLEMGTQGDHVRLLRHQNTSCRVLSRVFVSPNPNPDRLPLTGSRTQTLVSRRQ